MRLLILLLASAASLVAAPEYTFTLHGEAIHPKILPVMGDRKGDPAPGDLGFAAEIPFLLQGPGHYQLRTHDDNGTHLLCRLDDQPEGLVGVVIAFGTQELPEADWKTTALTVRNPPSKPTTGPPTKGALSLPVLPGHLRYLSIQCPPHRWLDDPGLAALGGEELVYLSLEGPALMLPLVALRPCRKLRNLSIEGGSILHPGVLETLTQLRFLKLRSLQGLESVEFASHLPELRVLKVDGTAVTDLRPVEGLEHLRLLSANQTEVGLLPGLSRLPSLHDFRIHSTPVSKQKATIAPLRPVANVLVKNWDPAIRAFEADDADNRPLPDKPHLFIGSSSVRLWDLKTSFPHQVTLNRGFGGSELSDSLRYFDRIVLPYRPRSILLYAGDNDIGNGESVDQVVADYQVFAAKVRAHLPKTDFAYIPIKPSLKRWELWPEMNKANDAIRKLTEADPRLHYLDTATPMLGADGTPRKELFVDDGLHLNANGYTLWTGIVGPWLESL